MAHRLIVIIVIIGFLISQFGFAQELIDFSVSPCDKNALPQFTRNRIISKELKNDTLTLRLGMVFNCCVKLDPTANLSSDSLFINFIDDSNDSIIEYCGCDCCYELEIQLTGIPDSNVRLFRAYRVYDIDSSGFKDWSEIEELKYHSNKYIFPSYKELEEYLDYSGQTNLLTPSGQRTGLWKVSSDDSNDDSFSMYYYLIDDTGKNKVKWVAKFDDQVKLISISVRTGPNDMSYITSSQYYQMFAPSINFIKN